MTPERIDDTPTFDVTELSPYIPALRHIEHLARREARRREDAFEPTEARVVRGTADEVRDLREMLDQARNAP